MCGCVCVFIWTYNRFYCHNWKTSKIHFQKRFVLEIHVVFYLSFPFPLIKLTLFRSFFLFLLFYFEYYSVSVIFFVCFLYMFVASRLNIDLKMFISLSHFIEPSKYLNTPKNCFAYMFSLVLPIAVIFLHDLKCGQAFI